MRKLSRCLCAAAAMLAGALTSAAGAAEVGSPTPVAADWVAHDFKFHTGAMFPELKVHYTTVGNPSGEPVLVLHGTGGSGKSMLAPAFAGALFGPGQALDARKYYIILPDSIGAGGSSRPSQGLRTRFPQYDYADMVDAQYRLLTEGLHIKHLRLIIGFSMGGMESWIWGERYPDYMDALVPMAAQPTAMAARNWMMRRLLVEAIRQDPAYRDGNYTTQPASLRLANALFAVGTNGGTLAWQAKAPTTAQANALVTKQLAAKPPVDANDFIYQWSASYDYDPEPELGKIKAAVLVINGADDERNPPQTGVTEQALRRVAHAEIDLIPASADTNGHSTPLHAHWYSDRLAAFLSQVPHGH